jgi:hypothetical protein
VGTGREGEKRLGFGEGLVRGESQEDERDGARAASEPRRERELSLLRACSVRPIQKGLEGFKSPPSQK